MVDDKIGTPVARRLLAMETNDQRDMVRRVVREMTEWAAPLGSNVKDTEACPGSTSPQLKLVP